MFCYCSWSWLMNQTYTFTRPIKVLTWAATAAVTVLWIGKFSPASPVEISYLVETRCVAAGAAPGWWTRPWTERWAGRHSCSPSAATCPKRLNKFIHILISKNVSEIHTEDLAKWLLFFSTARIKPSFVSLIRNKTETEKEWFYNVVFTWSE